MAIHCIGELLIDWIGTDVGKGLKAGEHFVKKAGGAPANVAVAATRLGSSAEIFAAVGSDPFGDFLTETLAEAGVGTQGILRKKHPTTFAFVALDSEGERDFVFHRGADAHYNPSEGEKQRFLQNAILHFGSATGFLGGELTDTYYELYNRAEGFLSFDPNYRPDLWKGRVENFIAASLAFMKKATFVKVSEEELHLISQGQGISALHELGVETIAVTLGKDGALLSTRQGEQLHIPSIPVTAVDSTGAGDAFLGAILFQIERDGIPQVFEKWAEVTAFANKVGAITCTHYGAMEALPSLAEVEAFSG